MSARNQHKRARGKPQRKAFEVLIDAGSDYVALHQLNDAGDGTESVYISVDKLDLTIEAMRRAGAVIRSKASETA